MRGAGQFQQRHLGAQLSQELLPYFLKESDTAEMGGQVQKADSTNHQSTERNSKQLTPQIPLHSLLVIRPLTIIHLSKLQVPRQENDCNNSVHHTRLS